MQLMRCSHWSIVALIFPLSDSFWRLPTKAPDQRQICVCLLCVNCFNTRSEIGKYMNLPGSPNPNVVCKELRLAKKLATGYSQWWTQDIGWGEIWRRKSRNTCNMTTSTSMTTRKDLCCVWTQVMEDILVEVCLFGFNCFTSIFGSKKSCFMDGI